MSLQRYADRIALTINEGPRWISGDVRIQGARAIDPQQIIDGLMPAEQATTTVVKGARWPTGKPAWLDDWSLAVLSNRVAELMAERGYPAAKFTLEVTFSSARDVAELLIRIHDEGPPLRVVDAQLVGNRAQPLAHVLRYLQLPPETVLSLEVRAAIEDRLAALRGRLAQRSDSANAGRPGRGT